MAFPYLLLAAQAAGIATNMLAKNQQTKIGRQALRIEEAQISARMEQETLAATQDTLFDLQNLRETLASQQAIFASRGQRGGVGTAGALAEKSLRAYSSEQSVKHINQQFRKSYLESMKRLKRIEGHGLEATRSTELLSQSLNMVDFNQLFGSMLSPSKKGGFK